MNKSLTLIALVVMSALTGFAARAQSQAIDLNGEVKDQRGDAIVGAKVSLINERNLSCEAATDNRGRFRFTGVIRGSYRLEVSAEGFAPHQQPLSLADGAAFPRLTITLYPAIRETISVDEEANRIGLDPNRAAGAQVLKQKELEALPDDPDQFLEHLHLLATSSGSAPGDATVTVDGFLNSGRLPPKSAIREVRINPDLFSAEHDKPPYRGGRIEIYTRPGAGSFHGTGFFDFNDPFMNARAAFAAERADSKTRRYGFQLGGPLSRNKAGLLFDFEARDINESATVNAIVLDENIQPAAFRANMPAPKLLLIGSARGDWQINPANTFIARYEFNRDRLLNQGAGGFDLPDRAYDTTVTGHGLRFSETAVLSRIAFNEARLGLTLQRVAQRAASTEPAISVLGAFSSGGATVQSLTREEWRMEFADNLSIATGKHNLKMGAQIIARRIDDTRSNNFNGTFVFGGRAAPRLDSSGKITGAALINISGLEQYRRALLGLPGGEPTRFSITSGDPRVSVNQWTFTGFAQDEWRLRQDMALSLGLRYEGQTRPKDAVSLAPRIGVAFSPDKEQRWVLRARAGLFYERIGESLALETRRLDGQRQRQIIIDSPSFPDPFRGGTPTKAVPTIHRMDSDLRPPTSYQTQLGFERQLPRGWKLEASHYWSRGWAGLRSRNINAPLSGEGDDPLHARRPLGVKEDILQFESSGGIEGQVLFIGVNQGRSKFYNIYSGYLLFDFHSDADSPFALPQSSYDLSGEWARPSWQARHRAFIVGIFNLPYSLRVSSILNLASGTPYNITTGRDNNGDGNFNDRPGVTSADDPKAILTAFGALDATAINGSLGRNAGTNPFTAALDLNLSRTFTLAKRGAGSDSGYKLTLNARATNLLNSTNPLGVNGVLASPFFSLPNSAGPSRRIEVGARFSF